MTIERAVRISERLPQLPEGVPAIRDDPRDALGFDLARQRPDGRPTAEIEAMGDLTADAHDQGDDIVGHDGWSEHDSYLA